MGLDSATLDLVSLLADIGLVALLLLVLLGGAKRIWVWGSEHEETKEQLTTRYEEQLKDNRDHYERRLNEKELQYEARLDQLTDRLTEVSEERVYYRTALMRVVNVAETMVERDS